MFRATPRPPAFRWTFLLLLFSLALSPLAGAQALVVAQAIDLSGKDADIDKDYVTGAKTYFDDVNLHGGIRGRRIDYVVVDDEGVPAKTLELTRQFVAERHADVLFGYGGDEPVDAVVRSAAFRLAGVPLFAPLAGIEAGTPQDNVFFLRPSDGDEARRLAAFFADYGLSRIVLLHADSASGRRVATALAAQFAERRQVVVSTQALPKAETALDALGRTLAGSNPQAVILAADTIDSALAVRRLAPALTGTFICVLSRVNQQTFMELAGSRARGTVFAQVVPDPTLHATTGAAEHQKLMRKYRDEAPNQFTFEGYLAARALVTLLRDAPGRPGADSVAAALRAPRAIDLGALVVDFRPPRARGSSLIELSVLDRQGRLLR